MNHRRFLTLLEAIENMFPHMRGGMPPWPLKSADSHQFRKNSRTTPIRKGVIQLPKNKHAVRRLHRMP